MSRPHRYLMTPEIAVKLGTCPDEVLAKELGWPTLVVSRHRRVMRIPAYRDMSGVAIHLDAALLRKIDDLAPLLIERYRDAGLPLRTLDAGQVVEIAINELLAAARRAKTKASYSSS